MSQARMIQAMGWGLVALAAVLVLWKLFFADIQRRVKEEQGGRIVAEEHVNAAKETGIEATNTVVHRYERHVEIDRTVREGQDVVSRLNKGQQMDPEVDAAGAAALCRVHDSLCRPEQRD